MMKHLLIGFHLHRLDSNINSKVAIMFNNNAVPLSLTRGFEAHLGL